MKKNIRYRIRCNLWHRLTTLCSGHTVKPYPSNLTLWQTFLLKAISLRSKPKKQCGRHRRTISSDITGALARSDQELLTLCRVRTKDGVIRKGTDLTPKTLREMVKGRGQPYLVLQAGVHRIGKTT